MGAGAGWGGWTVLPVNEEEVVEVHAEEAREDLATAGRTREAAHVRGDSVWAAEGLPHGDACGRACMCAYARACLCARVMCGPTVRLQCGRAGRGGGRDAGGGAWRGMTLTEAPVSM